MLKVFLVEDEVVVREGMKQNIHWEEYGFICCGDASDGELAYPMIQELKPDILITDIKMPFMDGLELSRLVKKELPRTRIIILSGYEEFAYAKEAIGIGVTEYLLKPIASSVLLETVRKVGDIIQKEDAELRRISQSAIPENDSLNRKIFFSELVKGRIDLYHIIEKSKELKIDLKATVFNIILIKIFNDRDSTNEFYESQNKLEEELQIYYESEKRLVKFDRTTEGIALLLKGSSYGELQKIAGDQIRIIQEHCHNYHEINYFIGVGKPVDRISELKKSFDEANRALAYRYILEPNQAVNYNQLNQYRVQENKRIEIADIDASKIEKNVIYHFLSSGDVSEVELLLQEYIKSLGVRSTDSILFRQYLIMNIRFTVTAFIKQYGYKDEVMTHSIDMSQMSRVVSSADEMMHYLIEIIRDAINLRDQSATQKYRSTMDKAKAFIQENYHNENISLNSVANVVNISMSHFSTIFSQEAGKTFIEYLTEVRMDKAKELLRCTDMKTAEIGYAVGYKDPHYFSYIFKKTQQCSPKEFKTHFMQEGRWGTGII